MFTNRAQLCPWVSILPYEVVEPLKKEKEVIPLIQMLVKVSLDAIEIYENGQMAHLDALIGNYGCEAHAFNLLSLAHSNELKEECESLKSACQNIKACVLGRQLKGRSSTPKTEIRSDLNGPLDQVYTKLASMSMISPGMMYLIKSRMLTVTKIFVYHPERYDKREYEALITVQSNLNKNGEKKKFGIQDIVLNKIVSVAQFSMSESSILFMRAELEKLAIANEKEGRLVKKMMSDENICKYAASKTAKQQANICIKSYSCAFYNTKAVLLLLAELKAPLIIKKMTKKGELVQHFDFKSSGEFGKFEEMTQEEISSYSPKAPVIVCIAYIPDDMNNPDWLKKVCEYGLGNMILAGASQESQYVPKKPDEFPILVPEAAAEIKFQSEVKAQEIECLRMKGSIFDPDHFYCSSWEDRGKNLSEIADDLILTYSAAKSGTARRVSPESSDKLDDLKLIAGEIKS